MEDATRAARAVQQEELNKTARETTAKWLAKQGADYPEGKTCPVCGKDEWVVADLSHISIGTRHDTTRTYLVVPVACGNCGNMRIFHAGLMGAVPKEIPSTQDGDDPGTEADESEAS